MTGVPASLFGFSFKPQCISWSCSWQQAKRPPICFLSSKYIILSQFPQFAKSLKFPQSVTQPETFSNSLITYHQTTNQIFIMYTSAILLSLLPAVLAQYGYGNSGSSSSSTASSSSPASTTTSSTSGITTIAVGNGGLNFSPNNISLPVGSVVEFQFYPPTHSVAQAAFADPCTPLANNTGFFSGGFTTSSGTNSNVFSIKINDTKPIWYYCGYPGHCEAGMVGVINPP